VRVLAEKHAVDMPICEQVAEVCHNGVAARDGMLNLLARGGRSELE
jgi:glycerol-3-phosphate dehydrogenase